MIIATDQGVYPHRLNRDGSFDSICPRCFQTIASQYTEVSLAEDERRHICEGPRQLISTRYHLNAARQKLEISREA